MTSKSENTPSRAGEEMSTLIDSAKGNISGIGLFGWEKLTSNIGTMNLIMIRILAIMMFQMEQIID
jgi:hypothetical protein